MRSRCFSKWNNVYATEKRGRNQSFHREWNGENGILRRQILWMNTKEFPSGYLYPPGGLQFSKNFLHHVLGLNVHEDQQLFISWDIWNSEAEIPRCPLQYHIFLAK